MSIIDHMNLKDELSMQLISGRVLSDEILIGPNRAVIEHRRWKAPGWAKHVPKRYWHYIIRFGTYGPWTIHDITRNLITNNGRDNIHNTSLQASGQPAGLQYMAISSDATAPAVTDTSLAGEITGSGLARALATYAHTAGTNSSTLVYTFTNNTAGAVTNIQKSATFTLSSGGTIGFENTFTPDTLQIGDQLKETWTQNIG